MLLSEGYHKGGWLERVCKLVTAAPARIFNLEPCKGRIAVGADADLTLVDLQSARYDGDGERQSARATRSWQVTVAPAQRNTDPREALLDRQAMSRPLDLLTKHKVLDQSQIPILRGALWMGGAVLSFSAMAIAARELLAHMGPFEILFVRSALMLVIVLALVGASGCWQLVSTRRLPLHTLRNLAHFGGQYAWVYAIGALPLATVFAIEFTMPVWTALLALLFLKEHLNRARLVMLVLGIVGVLIILRPGFAFIDPAAFVMLAGAFLYAGNMIATKRLTTTDAPLTVLFWMALLQAPVALAAALPEWVAPRMVDLPWMLVMGVGSYTAHYCLTRALKTADATVVVPVDFTRLPLIAVVGALVYGEPFDPLVLIGAAVIFAGTYYSLSRESRR